jgi:hypothetical protein
MDRGQLGLGRLYAERGECGDEETAAAGEVVIHSMIWSACKSSAAEW